MAGRGAHDLGMRAAAGRWSGSASAATRRPRARQSTTACAPRARAPSSSRTAKAPPPAAAAPVAPVVVGEAPYAEAAGDTHDLTLDAADAALIDALHDPAGARKLVCVFLCGRPLALPPPLLAKLDALVGLAPGTEGAGVADVLFGDAPFEGRLSFSWPRDNAARREAREMTRCRRGFGL